MAVAAWQVWCRRGQVAVRGPLTLFGAQLALNLLWSALFFYFQNPAAALVEIIILWTLIAATMVVFLRVRRSAGLLMTPYLAWVTFASYLNIGFWYLNR
jgi:tryptophan-rich sensory protein